MKSFSAVLPPRVDLPHKFLTFFLWYEEVDLLRFVETAQS